MTSPYDDYDSPWKDAVERGLPEFLRFYFPTAYAGIDWSHAHVFLDKELQAVVQDAELGRRTVDKLVRRLFDRYRRPAASLIVLADDTPGWKPSSFGFELFGCRHHLDFPSVKLLDYAGGEDDLLAEEAPFALVTAARLETGGSG